MFGVTLGTLVVFCSKRGISLRRTHTMLLQLSDDILKSLREAAHSLGKRSAERSLSLSSGQLLVHAVEPRVTVTT